MALQEITDRFKITDYSDEFPVLDRYLKKTFRVAVREGKLVCLTDESGEDVHTFFVKNDLKFREAVPGPGSRVQGLCDRERSFYRQVIRVMQTNRLRSRPLQFRA